MKISIIGTNGLLANSFGQFCNKMGFKLDTFGRRRPQNHRYDTFHKIDLLKEEFFSESLKESDVIIYAAGAGIQSNLNESSSLIYSLNVDVPIKLCCKLKEFNYRGVFVSFGSYFEIGENSENIFFTEKKIIESQNKVFNDYTISKRVFTKFVTSFNSIFKHWHFILPTIYGENESSHRLIPYTINALVENKTIAFTSGEQIRQYIYVDDIPEILYKSFKENLDSGIYNIAGTETLSVKQLVTMLFNAFDKQLPEAVFGKTNRKDTGMKVLKLDASNLYKTINYEPKIKILDVYDRY